MKKQNQNKTQRIYFFKHGAPDVIDGDYFESELSEEFFLKTLQLIQSGEIPSVDIIYCSEYPRAIGCGRVFQSHFGVPLIVRPEVSNWRLQTQNSPNYATEEIKGWRDRKLIVEGGESLQQVEDRVIEFVESLKETENLDILVMSHGVTTELISAHYGGRVSSLTNKENIRSLGYAVLEERNGLYVLVKDALCIPPVEDKF